MIFQIYFKKRKHCRTFGQNASTTLFDYSWQPNDMQNGNQIKIVKIFKAFLEYGRLIGNTGPPKKNRVRLRTIKASQVK